MLLLSGQCAESRRPTEKQIYLSRYRKWLKSIAFTIYGVSLYLKRYRKQIKAIAYKLYAHSSWFRLGIPLRHPPPEYDSWPGFMADWLAWVRGASDNARCTTFVVIKKFIMIRTSAP
jgi:hypothetical protein